MMADCEFASIQWMHNPHLSNRFRLCATSCFRAVIPEDGQSESKKLEVPQFK
jgi:hypothetical protein